MRGRKGAKSDDSDDDDSQNSVQLDTNNAPKYIPVAKLGDKLKTKKIVLNISDTQYPILQEIAEELGWVVQRQEGNGDWDIWWTDREIEPNVLFRMNLHQKINHYPGIYILARKNLFGLGLMAMKQYHPQQYNFFPQTWTVPMQFSQFRHYYQTIQKGKTRTYIVKPQALSQGRGIFLTRNIQDILNGNKYVIQRYIRNPLLIDKLKFDLRIYVLMAGTDPLRLYIYHDGLTRFATQEYQEPNTQNINCNYIHLTNYALNKNNPKYVYNSSEKDMDKGHKRTLSSTYERLAKENVDVQALKASIQDAIIKSVISGLPTIRHQYQYCQPQEYEGNMCFHILGFDVMLTDDYKPIVIEVNHTPSFETGTPLDYLVKKNLIKDTLKLMRITQKNKRKHFERAKQIAKNRLQTGKRDIFKGKERQEAVLKARQTRDQLEKDLLGGFKKIFPPDDPAMEAKYNRFYESAVKISKEENDIRKKILNDEKSKKEQKKQQQKKNNIKNVRKTFSKEEKPLCNFQPKEPRVKADSRSSKEQMKPKEQPFQTLQELKEEADKTFQNNSTEHNIEKEIIEVGTTKDMKNSFRTKVNKKLSNGSNNQLIKYTESIKKFNDLMVKYVVRNSSNQNYRQASSSNHDSEYFQKIKKKLQQTREQKGSANGGYPPLGKESKGISMTPVKDSRQSGPAAGIHCTKLQIKNGSFVKPKNYLLSEARDIHNMKMHKKWSAEEQPHPTKEFMLIGSDPLLGGGIIAENRSTKAYSKLMKAPVGRGLCIRR